MYISKIRVHNYKAFHDSGWIEFKPGINIISGQNHSGKTALLEALSLNFVNTPHKSLKTIPTVSSTTTVKSEVIIEIAITKEEIEKFIIEDDSEIILPQPIYSSSHDFPIISSQVEKKFKEQSIFKIQIPFIEKSYSNLKIKDFFDNQEYVDNLLFNSYQVQKSLFPRSTSGLVKCFAFNYDDTSKKIDYKKIVDVDLKQITLIAIALQLLSKVKIESYRFYAERKAIGIYSFGDSLELNPDASNIAQVIHCLQSRFPSKYNQFNDLISIVLPHITRISTRPIIDDNKNEVELRIWSIDPETDRDDLAFPLEACGTGVGQVLAILYVVITSEEPRTIIIDEPQSFLHPGAARKLIEILQDFPQHQYFISTHSPSIISAANPATITLLKYHNSEATPVSISSDDSKEMRSLLDEVGVHLSDVFGSDNILWVEGPTEERCFPIILRKIAKIPLRGTEILALKNTGDLEGRKSKIYFDIYDRLSGGKALLPPAVGFILDNEKKSAKDLADLKRRSGDKLEFLDRCMYENYLLVPEAIMAIANQYKFRDEPLSVLEIEQWIVKQKQDWIDKKIRKGEKKENLTDDYWLKKVHAARLLETLFKHFSGDKVTYRKTVHSIKLTEWIVDNQPEALQDIADLLKKILTRSPEVNSLK